MNEHKNPIVYSEEWELSAHNNAYNPTPTPTPTPSTVATQVDMKNPVDMDLLHQTQLNNALFSEVNKLKFFNQKLYESASLLVSENNYLREKLKELGWEPPFDCIVSQ